MPINVKTELNMTNYRTIMTILLCAVVAFACPAQASAYTKDKKDKKEKKSKDNKDKTKDDDTLDLGLEPMPMPKAPQPEARVVPVRDLAGGNRRFHTGNFDFTGRRGIDISHYQGNIDWAQVATDPQVKYVYMKATESNGFVDKTFARNLKEAQAVGLPVGAYHFFNPNTSARSQFENFRRVVDPQTQDLIPVVDVEQRGSCDLSGFRTRLQQFCDLVEQEYGVKPVIYCGAYFYNKYLTGMFYGYKIFCARYTTDRGIDPEFEPNCHLVLWQHSDKGSIKGIRGNVDLSRFCGNYNLNDILLVNTTKK